jgi:hypothetical protein
VNATAQRILLLLALAAFLAALTRFTILRFQRGDLYPEYSSLRADPIGAKALFESFKRIEPQKVSRNFESIEKLAHEPGSTTVFLGESGFNDAFDDSLLSLSRDGGRVVVALDAKNGGSFSTNKNSFRSRTVKGTNTFIQSGWRSLLGVNLTPQGQSKKTSATRALSDADLPETIPWFGNYAFGPATNDWESVYEIGGNAVIIQKKYGLGKLVLCADSYPFSNEALYEHPEPAFLLWALGDGRVTFDETHLGVERGTGVAVLMREFRLHGLAAGCLLLVALWIWRNSAPLVPPRPAQVVVESVEGKTAREAVVHLLRRNLSDVDVLKQGLEEWARANPPRHYWQQVRIAEARKLADYYATLPKPRDLAGMQRKISELLSPKRNQL